MVTGPPSSALRRSCAGRFATSIPETKTCPAIDRAPSTADERRCGHSASPAGARRLRSTESGARSGRSGASGVRTAMAPQGRRLALPDDSGRDFGIGPGFEAAPRRRSRRISDGRCIDSTPYRSTFSLPEDPRRGGCSDLRRPLAAGSAGSGCRTGDNRCATRCSVNCRE